MAVAAEWDAQTSSKGIEPALMPLMSLASTAIDQVRAQLQKVGHRLLWVVALCFISMLCMECKRSDTE